MAKPLVSDELWSVVEPLFPAPRPKKKDGRPRIPDRACLTGIVFVLKTGIQWEDLPREMGCGSGMTCWRRLRDWQEAGVWEALHRTRLDGLGEAGRIDWSRVSIDSSTIPAKGAKQGGHRPRRSARTRPIAASRGRSTTW
jgi:transposase